MFMIAKHGMSPATALILYNYNGKVFASTRAVAGAADAFYRLLLSSERVYQLMESSDFSREAFGDKALETVNGDIELKNVRFAYRNKGYAPVPVIKNMDLHIPAGQSVALIGRIGCGKSAVLSLISRLYEPNGGTITLDGADISTLNQDTIRNSIGVVTQTPYLFSMSLRDNFRLVKNDVTDEEIVEVCKTACVHDDIMPTSKTERCWPRARTRSSWSAARNTADCIPRRPARDHACGASENMATVQQASALLPEAS